VRPFLVVDEGVSQEHDYRRFIRIWGHPELIGTLVSAAAGENFYYIDSITCKNRVSTEIFLHQLADDSDVASLRAFVESSWADVRKQLVEAEEPRTGLADWIGDDVDEGIDNGTLSGLGDLMRPKTRDQKRMLITLLHDAARNLYDIGSADLRDEFVPDTDSAPEGSEEATREDTELSDECSSEPEVE